MAPVAGFLPSTQENGLLTLARSALATEEIWGENQWMEALSPPLHFTKTKQTMW